MISRWDKPDSNRKVLGPISVCRSADFDYNQITPESCGAYNQPWCYTKTEGKRYDTCNVPNCGCSRTFLRFTKHGQNQSVPWDLSSWKSNTDNETAHFIDLLDPWRDNRPCTDAEKCPPMADPGEIAKVEEEEVEEKVSSA